MPTPKRAADLALSAELDVGLLANRAQADAACAARGADPIGLEWLVAPRAHRKGNPARPALLATGHFGAALGTDPVEHRV